MGGGTSITSCGETIIGAVSAGYCPPQCFPLDASALDALDAGDAGDGSASVPSYCAALCGTGNWYTCGVTTRDGVSLAKCQLGCTGRRPEGWSADSAAGDGTLGAHFAEMARLEAASVEAFRHLRRELVAHRAPRRLVRAAERAARDEVRHARMTAALARRFGECVVEPRIEPRPVRTLTSMAVENAVEGCVREAFGALVAAWQAQMASDPVIREVMSRIARDEARHAELGLAVNAWVRGRLDRAGKSRVMAARQEALTAIAGEAAPPPASIAAALGLPSREQTRSLSDAFRRLAAA
jgi:hypothetical protein